MDKIIIKANWDNEAEVWFAESEDVPGLVTEADTIEILVEKLKSLIPELLELNNMLDSNEHLEIPFHVLSERKELIK